jgi:hypothetical protein
MFKFVFIFLVFLPNFLAFSQNHSAELSLQETNIEIKGDKLYKTHTYEITIYNRSGERFGTIGIPYSKLNHVSKITAYIKDSQGKLVRKLKKNEISTRSAIAGFSFYEDDFVKEFTLKHNRYPYTIVYSYQEIQDEFLYIDYFLPIINTQIPTRKAVLTVETPKSYKIAFDAQLTDDFQERLVESNKKYRWELSYKKLIKSEYHSPTIYNFLPRVIIVPESFYFDKEGSFKSWLSYGNWLYEVNQGLSFLPESEKQKIRSLIKDVDSQKEKIRILYHYLQDNTRYINVTIETGGMKPYPASYVAKNKYGDCKALTNYFKSVLDFVDIEAFYTIVYADDAIKKVNKEFPSHQFNHVILSVPFQKDTLWLDCTSDAAFNHLGTFTQNRYALIVDKNKSHFVKTPALSKQDVLETRSVKFISNQDNIVTANFENQYAGNEYESLFYYSHGVNDARKAQIIRDYYVEKGFELDKFNLTSSHRDTASMHLSYVAKAANFYKKYGNDVLIPLLPFSIADFEEPEDRKLPLQLDYPIYKVDTLEYQLLEGTEFSASSKLLENQVIANEFGEYKIEFEHQTDKIKVIKSFLLHAGYYSEEEYERFHAFLDKVEQIEVNIYITVN